MAYLCELRPDVPQPSKCLVFPFFLCLPLPSAGGNESLFLRYQECPLVFLLRFSSLTHHTRLFLFLEGQSSLAMAIPAHCTSSCSSFPIFKGLMHCTDYCITFHGHHPSPPRAEGQQSHCPTVLRLSRVSLPAGWQGDQVPKSHLSDCFLGLFLATNVRQRLSVLGR